MATWGQRRWAENTTLAYYKVEKLTQNNIRIYLKLCFWPYGKYISLIFTLLLALFESPPTPEENIFHYSCKIFHYVHQLFDNLTVLILFWAGSVQWFYQNLFLYLFTPELHSGQNSGITFRWRILHWNPQKQLYYSINLYYWTIKRHKS